MIHLIEGNKSFTSFNPECSLLVGKGFPQTIYHKLDRFPAESGESTWAATGIPSIKRH